MQRLTPTDLMSLEQYARERAVMRARLMEHRRRRALALGEHCTWSFEDRQTVQYQVQEILRVERIFEPSAIAEELEAYNPLIPDGSNLKATVMIEYPDALERDRQLAQLRGFAERCWMRVAGFEPIYAIADEDLDRDSEEKTSAVHFVRFEFTGAMITALGSPASLAAGIDHPAYRCQVDPLPDVLRHELMQDFA